jgi:hypothetical protein
MYRILAILTPDHLYEFAIFFMIDDHAVVVSAVAILPAGGAVPEILYPAVLYEKSQA